MGDPGQAGSDVTQLLHEWRSGRKDALERLMPLVYDELHLIASRHMAREWRVSALQTTALVNEAYLKLVGQRDVDWQNRAHFFAIAAQLMRRILVDNARRDQRPKHGRRGARRPGAAARAGRGIHPVGDCAGHLGNAQSRRPGIHAHEPQEGDHAPRVDGRADPRRLAGSPEARGELRAPGRHRQRRGDGSPGSPRQGPRRSRRAGAWRAIVGRLAQRPSYRVERHRAVPGPELPPGKDRVRAGPGDGRRGVPPDARQSRCEPESVAGLQTARLRPRAVERTKRRDTAVREGAAAGSPAGGEGAVAPDLAARSVVSYGAIGAALLSQGDLRGALARYEEAVRLRRAVVEEDPGEDFAKIALARGYDRLATIHGRQGDVAGAFGYTRQRIAILRGRLEAHPDRENVWTEYAQSVFGAAGACLDLLESPKTPPRVRRERAPEVGALLDQLMAIRARSTRQGRTGALPPTDADLHQARERVRRLRLRE